MFPFLHAERESRSAAKNENNSVVTMLGTVTTLLFVGYCMAEHSNQPSGWWVGTSAQPTVHGPGQADPRMVGLDPA